MKSKYLTIISEPYLKPVGTKGKQQSFVLCVCVCGIKKEFRVSALKNCRETTSCGCINRKLASERCKNNTKHLNCNHPLYNSWKSMKTRCRRGDLLVKVCDDWKKNFKSFFDWSLHNGWEDGLELSRKDTSQDFCPENCCFKTHKEATENNFNLEKTRQTSLKKYGTEHPTQHKSVKQKKKKTNLERYGANSPLGSKQIQDKIKKSNLKKYGYEYACQHPDVKVKMAETNLKRYGGKSPSDNIHIREKQIETCIERYGVPFPRHNKNVQTQEKDIAEFLKSYGFIFQPDRKILQRKEIDLYNQELNLAIEYCGLYWHTEHSPEPRTKNYHFNKYKKCLEQGIQLITIFSDEWLFRKPQVLNFLLSKTGKFVRRIFARKCIIKTVEPKIAREFIDSIHIQLTARSALVYFGLFIENELIGCMSLNRHHRANQKIILDRLCFKQGVQVVGGASKLFSSAVKWCKEQGITEITTWSDNRWSLGKVYESLGFIKECDLPPDYSYVEIAKAKKRHSKQSMTKAKIGCRKDQKEHEFLKDRGFYRIWDCGKKRFVYKISH